MTMYLSEWSLPHLLLMSLAILRFRETLSESCTSCVYYSGLSDDPAAASILEAFEAAGNPYCRSYPYDKSNDVIQCPPSKGGEKSICATADLTVSLEIEGLELELMVYYRGCELVPDDKTVSCNPAKDDYDRMVAAMGSIGPNVRGLVGTVCYCEGPVCQIDGQTTKIPPTTSSPPTTTPLMSSLFCNTCVRYYGEGSNPTEDSILEVLMDASDPECGLRGSGQPQQCPAPSGEERVTCAVMNLTVSYFFESEGIDVVYGMIAERCAYINEYQGDGCYDGQDEKTRLLAQIGDGGQFITDLQGIVCYCDQSQCRFLPPTIHCLSCLAFGGHSNDADTQAVISSLKLFGDQDCLTRPQDVISVECPIPDEGMVAVCNAGNITATYTVPGSDLRVPVELYMRGCDTIYSDSQPDSVPKCSEVDAHTVLDRLELEQVRNQFTGFKGKICQCAKDNCNTHDITFPKSEALRCKRCIGYGGETKSPTHSTILQEIMTYGHRDCLNSPESETVASVSCPTPGDGMVAVCVSGNVEATYKPWMDHEEGQLRMNLYMRGCELVPENFTVDTDNDTCNDIQQDYAIGPLKSAGVASLFTNFSGEVCHCNRSDCNQQQFTQPERNTSFCPSCLAYELAASPRSIPLGDIIQFSNQPECVNRPFNSSMRAVQCLQGCVESKIHITFIPDIASPSDFTNMTLYLRGCAEEFPGLLTGCSKVEDYEDVIKWIFNLKDNLWMVMEGDICHCERGDCAFVGAPSSVLSSTTTAASTTTKKKKSNSRASDPLWPLLAGCLTVFIVVQNHHFT